MSKSHIRGIVRTILFLTMTVLVVPVYLICFPLGWHVRRPFILLWNRLACLIAGIKVRVHGSPNRKKGTFLVCNHVSYVDIPVIASTIDATFVAKADVETWPLFGFLAKIAQTVFIEREANRVTEQVEGLRDRLIRGEKVLIFPEGTSSDGKTVLPYKSSLFQLTKDMPEEKQPMVQPMSVAYLYGRNGMRFGQFEDRLYPWYGEMTLVPHLWEVMKLHGVIVDLMFHEPVPAADFSNRKQLAQYAHEQTLKGIDDLRTGKIPAPDLGRRRKGLGLSGVTVPDFSLID